MSSKDGKYQKILKRKDGSRPHYIKELNKDPLFNPDDMILSIKVLKPSGITITSKWAPERDKKS